MAWLSYVDYSLYAAIGCALLGYATFPLLRARYSIGGYTTSLLAWVFGVTLLAFMLSFFGPIVFAGGRDTVAPIFGSLVVGPLGAIIGLIGFWIYAFTRKGT